jgi:hypothetical protein
VISADRSLLKEEAPGFSADFNHPLSCERPFEFPRHLVQALGIDGIICHVRHTVTVHSTVIKFNTDTEKNTEKNTEPNMDTDKDKTRTRTQARTRTRT